MFYLADVPISTLEAFIGRYNLKLEVVPPQFAIPFSFWGSPEAGRKLNVLYARSDTPIHSLLHESAHYVCMTESRRNSPAIHAYGTTLEESACCYLQLLWSKHLPPFTIEQHLLDMDHWGYSFRLGSADAWYHQDAEDAQQWLLEHDIIDRENNPTWKPRQNVRLAG